MYKNLSGTIIRNTIIILFILFLAACSSQQVDYITILSTADTHSQVEPISANVSRDPNKGGYARRMGYIKKEREPDPNRTLLDDGHL